MMCKSCGKRLEIYDDAGECVQKIVFPRELVNAGIVEVANGGRKVVVEFVDGTTDTAPLPDSEIPPMREPMIDFIMRSEDVPYDEAIRLCDERYGRPVDKNDGNVELFP